MAVLVMERNFVFHSIRITFEKTFSCLVIRILHAGVTSFSLGHER